MWANQWSLLGNNALLHITYSGHTISSVLYASTRANRSHCRLISRLILVPTPLLHIHSPPSIHLSFSYINIYIYIFVFFFFPTPHSFSAKTNMIFLSLTFRCCILSPYHISRFLPKIPSRPSIVLGIVVVKGRPIHCYGNTPWQSIRLIMSPKKNPQKVTRDTTWTLSPYT